MTYKEARIFIDGCNQYAGEITLEPLKEMLNRLGNPQDRLKFVHVAGTNGKGSVLAYVSTVLKKAGYRIGRYISPTIVDYLERISMTGEDGREKFIPEEDFARLAEKIQNAGEQMLAKGLGHPTTFEAETALMFLWFAEQNCDLVMLEVGRGGRTDATNVVSNTIVAVLASISMDHMEFLGNTLEEIAANKAGIIKPGCTVATLKQKPEAQTVILKEAESMSCPVVIADPSLISNKKRALAFQSFDYKGRKGIEISLSGEYQFENAALALEVIEILRKKGYEIPEDAIQNGLRETSWGGRFSVIAKEPYVIVDGTHNRDAADKLELTIQNYLAGKHLIFIMAVLADKEYDYIVQKTVPYAAEVITVMTPDNPRALPAEKLAETVAKYNSHVQAAGSIRDAIRRAYELADKEDVILAFGSLSYLGELMGDVIQKEEWMDK